MIFDCEDGVDTFHRNLVHIWTVQHYILEDGSIHNYHGEDVKSCGMPPFTLYPQFMQQEYTFTYLMQQSI